MTYIVLITAISVLVILGGLFVAYRKGYVYVPKQKKHVHFCKDVPAYDVMVDPSKLDHDGFRHC
jgi:hypothetical protein